jgi:SpoIID/LytB domain protein
MRILTILSLIISTLIAGIAVQPVMSSDDAKNKLSISSDDEYKKPAWRDIVSGATPLRVLIAGHQQSFGWKSNDAVTITDKNYKVLFNCTTAHNYTLEKTIDNLYKVRRDGVSVLKVPGEIILIGKKVMTFTTATDSYIIDPGISVSIVINGALHASRLIDLEDYTRLVSQGEAPRKFPREVLRAHAVLARTYPLTKLAKHADEHADVCATIDCQTCSYGKYPCKEWDDALKATDGIYLKNSTGLPADVYYSNSCGGMSDDAGYIWGPEYARPYLRPISDVIGKTTYCAGDPKYTWERKFTIEQVNKLVAMNLPIINNDPTAVIKNVTDIRVEVKSPGGRGYITRIEGDNSSLIVRTEAIRWLFGSGKPAHDGLPSDLFVITPDKDAKGKLTGFTFNGTGCGHGIGMCLWGAVGRAKAGQNYRTILHTYFPTAMLSDENKNVASPSR